MAPPYGYPPRRHAGLSAEPVVRPGLATLSIIRV